MNVLLIPICGAWMAALLLVLFGMKGKAKHDYDEHVAFLDKKDYALKDLFPAGFYYIESGLPDKLMPLKIKTIWRKYDTANKRKIMELYGVEDFDFYMLVHNANKVVMSLFVGFIFALLSFIMSATGDATNAVLFLVFSITALVGLGFVLDKSLDTKIEKRRMEISLEFPEFVNKITLLVNAGMTISKAWDKVVTDNRKTNVLYVELKRASAEISAGKPESAAYEDFGKRCKVKEVMKFVSVIVLNLKKGGAEIVPTLKLQGDECWEARKNTAKQLGEKASSKIMLPMMMMFIGVILIVAVPALLSFKQGM